MPCSDWDWKWGDMKADIKQSFTEAFTFDRDNSYSEGEPFFIGALLSVISLTCVIRALADGSWIVKIPQRPIPSSWIFEPLVDASTPETVLLYFSLVSGVLTWICILLRSNESRVALTTKLTTCLLALNIVLLASCLTIWHFTHVTPAVPWWYSTGYFSLCEALGLSVVALVCYLVDWLYLHFPSGSLTIARRKMITSTLVTMTVMVIGGLVFEALEPRWDFPTAFQWMVISSLTIGYGHVVAVSTGARVFLFLYGPIGIAVIGYFLLSIKDMIQESSHSRMRRTIAKRRLNLTVMGSRNANMHTLASRKYTMTQDSIKQSNTAPASFVDPPPRPVSVNSVHSTRPANSSAIAFADATTTPEDEAQVARWLDQPVSILRPSNLDTESSAVTCESPSAVIFGESIRQLNDLNVPPQEQSRTSHDNQIPGAGIPLNNIGSYTSTISLDPGLVLSAKDEEDIRYKSQIWAAIRMTFIWLFMWFIGSLIFDSLEPDWSYMDSLYFTWSTLTTVGYGDYVPSSPATWEFWFWYVLVQVAIFAYLIAMASELFSTKVHERFQRTLTEQADRQGVIPEAAGIPKAGEATFEQEYTNEFEVSRENDFSVQPVTSGEQRLAELRQRNLGQDGTMV